jgi:hypothetical protein
MKRFIFLSLLLALAGSSYRCAEKTDLKFEEENFTSFFDNNQFNAVFSPIDVKQTRDGGYLILGSRKLPESTFAGIYLLKANKYGNFIKELEVESTYVNAVAHFALLNDKYYFFCMSSADTRVHLAEVDENLDAILVNPVSGGLSYPMASSLVDETAFALLSYNNFDKQSVISIVRPNGTLSAVKTYSIGVGDKVEEPIMNHFIRTGRQYPFAIGKTANNVYFFNGFYDYTFSLVFTNFTADTPPLGVVQGQQDDGGCSAILPLSGNKFALARFDFGENYLVPGTILNPGSITSAINLGGYTVPELVPNAKVKILSATANGKNVLMYATDTRSKQIGLFAYEEATGTLLGSHYIGFSNPFEVGNIIQTTDGGLAVCGTTYIAGRFPRICLIKLSKEKLGQIAGQ